MFKILEGDDTMLVFENNIIIKQAELSDLDELHSIECLSFPPEKAASYDAFEYRLTSFPQWFFKAEMNGKIIGLIDGSQSDKPYITDDLYEQDGGFDDNGENLLIYGLAVHPEHRHIRIAHRLMEHIIACAKAVGIKHISLTCKQSLISFYESMGFKNHGISESVKGNVVSFDMELYTAD